jgi:hypothetical protein
MTAVRPPYVPCNPYMTTTPTAIRDERHRMRIFTEAGSWRRLQGWLGRRQGLVGFGAGVLAGEPQADQNDEAAIEAHQDAATHDQRRADVAGHHQRVMIATTPATIRPPIV